MPSQNLPKPNLPGQLQHQQQAAGAPGSDSQTVFTAPAAPSVPVGSPPTPTPTTPQAVPPGLSRENPGGTPPQMQVAAPAGNLQSIPSLSAKPANSSATTQQPVMDMRNPLTAPSPIPARPQSPTAPITQATVDTNLNALKLTQSAPKGVVPPQPTATVSPTLASNTPQNAAATPTPAATPPSIQPKPKFSLPRPLLIALGVVLLLAIVGGIFAWLRPASRNTTTNRPSTTNPSTQGGTATPTGTTTPTTTLTYWGLWEDSQILKEVIADFEKQNPSIKIDYRKQSHRDYRERLQQAIASGTGPDLFRYHVAWVPMLSADLAPLPSSVMSATEYKQIFYPTAANNLQVGGQIVGVPLMYDGLALLYNKEMLRTANIDVPKTWAELRTAANKLTVPAAISERQGGNITRSGLAIGNAGNVDHFADILALLIVQNGGNPGDAGSQYVKDAVTFYTNFIKQDKIWSERLANSTTAFARGDVAMIFAPSWRIHDIKNLNPSLEFGVARVPQLDSENPIAWASFWAEGVNGKSKSKDAAWTFLKYMSTPDVLRKFYTDARQYRSFGELFPRTDMATELQSDEMVGAYLADAPLAKSWYMSSFTHDNGLNDQVIKYYEDAVTAVLAGTDVEKALATTLTGITSVLAKYSSTGTR